MDAVKILVIVVFFGIVWSLGSALFQMARNKGPTGDDQSGDPAQKALREEHSRKMARALTFRVGLSVILFILLMLAWYNGLITPHGLARH